jgi:hypothetical protein
VASDGAAGGDVGDGENVLVIDLARAPESLLMLVEFPRVCPFVRTPTPPSGLATWTR